MDLATCLKKMELVGVLAFATVDSDGAPQIRNISAIHYESDAIYFFIPRYTVGDILYDIFHSKGQELL